MSIKGFGISKDKETIEDLNFVVSKLSNKEKLDWDVVKITESSISVSEKKINQKFPQLEGSIFGALTVYSGHICLILTDKRDSNVLLFNKSKKNANRRYMNVPKAAKEMTKKFKGNYKMEHLKKIEHYTLYRLYEQK